MAPTRERVVIDPEGDVFLLLQRKGDQPVSEGEAAAKEPATASSQINRDEQPVNCTVAGLPQEEATREVEMQVSSKHLSLASEVFAGMFRSRSLGGLASSDEESVTIPLAQDDFEAIQVLLNIITWSDQKSAPKPGKTRLPASGRVN
jgi:hypothetical protein